MLRMGFFRHHTRDLVFIVAALTLLSLYLSCQNTSLESRKQLQRKEESIVQVANSRKEVNDGRGRITFESMRRDTGSDQHKLEGFRNVLEGIELTHEDSILEKTNEKKTFMQDSRREDGEMEKRNPLVIHLQKLEDERDLRFQDAAKVAMVRGEDDVIRRDLPLYKQALEKKGFMVVGQTIDDKAKDIVGEIENQGNYANEDWRGWVLLLCLSLGEADETGCLQRTSLSRLEPFQKPSVELQKRELVINRIPGIKDVLWRKDAFCYTSNQARKIPTLRRSQLAPICWVLPAQFDEFMMTADALGSDVRWVFKTPGGDIQVLQPIRDRDYQRIQQYRSERAVVQQYFPNPLLIFGSPVSVRAYVLVTSINPLRAYIHSEGEVFFRQDYQKGFTKIPSRKWTLEQFKLHLVHTFGTKASLTASRNLEIVITETLLVAEPSLVADFSQFTHPWEHPYRCLHCFQLLAFDVIFNSTLHPIVIEVSGQPDLHSRDADQQWSSNIINQKMVDETLSMIFSTRKVAQKVAGVIEKLHMGVEIFGCNETDTCLTNEDLEFLMKATREKLSGGGFFSLYPSAGMERYRYLIQEIKHFISSHPRRYDTSSPPPPPHPSPSKHSTKDLHPVLVAMETAYLEEDLIMLEEMNEGEDEMMRMGLDKESDDEGVLIKNVFGLDRRSSEMRGPSCSEDPDTMHLLAALHTWPHLNLTFDPHQTLYHAEVDYDQIVVQIGAFAMSCDCEARLEDKYGVSRPVNFTLGLGSNRISIYVVDITHSKPWVLGEYTLYIQRHHSRNRSAVSFELEERQAVCTLVQDCNLPYIPHHSCGLRLLADVSWSEVITMATTLPPCTGGDAPGQWLVPCDRCSDEKSCDWDRAQWQPHDCRYQDISQSEARKCLAGKKLLFIGDSTNRGIMYYLMEKMNSSLYEWDKAHDTKLYTNLNNGRTAVGFSYYPQFWLPISERPMFEETFWNLLRMAGPLVNDSRTVVVVGGVHWMAFHHLTVIQQVLKRAGLSGIQKIVKGLGAGFHQPVDGIHCLTLDEQRKVYFHNRGLQNSAVAAGWGFVDTFNMTMSRYRDFLEGKCACHFHKVDELRHDQSQEGALHQDKVIGEKSEVKGESKGRYHVTGRINAIYSEILLSQVCGRK